METPGIVNRLQGKLIRVDAEWGRAVDPDAVRTAVRDRSPKIIAVVHAETSTGVCQPLDDLARIARECGALFLVDTVTSLGGMEVSLASPAPRDSRPSRSAPPPWKP